MAFNALINPAPHHSFLAWRGPCFGAQQRHDFPLISPSPNQ